MRRQQPHDVLKIVSPCCEPYPQVNNESNSVYTKENCEAAKCDEKNEEYEESNLMHNINGRVFANLDGLEMKVGENVRWFVFAFGTEVNSRALFALVACLQLYVAHFCTLCCFYV